MHGVAHLSKEDSAIEHGLAPLYHRQRAEQICEGPAGMHIDLRLDGGLVWPWSRLSSIIPRQRCVQRRPGSGLSK